MMLPGPRLLLRAVLLLGTARCSSGWSTPGTPGHPHMSLPAGSRPHRWGAAPSPAPPGREGLMAGGYRIRAAELSPEIQNRTPREPNRTGTDPPSEPNRTGTDPPSEPNRTGTDPPSEPNRTGTDPPSEPNRTGTDPPSEPNRTGTDPPSQPNRTGTDPPSEPNRTGTDPPSEPNRTGTDPPSEPNRTGTDPPSDPNRTGTDPPSEPNRTGTDPPSEPNRTGTDPPSEPNRTGTDPPSDPNRTGTDPPSEPNRTGTDPPSEPNRTGTDPPSEPNRTGTDPPSEPNRTGTDPPSEPNRTGTDPPSEPNRTGTDPPSEPNRTGTDPPSEPNRTGTDPPSEPNRTGTDPPSEPNRTGTDPPSEPNRTGTDPPSEPNRTGTDPPSEPNRTWTYPTSEPNRTGTDPTSDPNRTGTYPTSEPNRTGTDPTSEPNRTASPSLSADIEKTQTFAGLGQTGNLLGPHIYYRSEPNWTDISQTSSDSGISQKSASQRHVNKRTPVGDTTYISTTRGGDRTLLFVTSNVSDITEIPDVYPTSRGSVLQESTTAAQGEERSTEVRNVSSQAAPSAPTTYPLQTPSYVVTTYPSPMSHHMPNTTFPFISVSITEADRRNSLKTTGVTPRNSSVDLWSSPADLSSVGTSSSALTTTSMAASSSFPGERSQQPPSQVSYSSPVPSTARSSASPSLTTHSPHPLTAMSSTPGSPIWSTSLPPSLTTESSPGDGAEKKQTLTPSISPTDANTSMAASPGTPSVVTERRLHDETTPMSRDITPTRRPLKMQTTAITTEGMQRATVGTWHVGTTDSALSTTTTNIPLTTPPSDTLRTTGPGSSAPTTAGRELFTRRTTQTDLNTEAPRPHTTVSTKAKKPPPVPTPPSTTPAVRSAVTGTPSTTTRLRANPTTAASPCSSSPCQNGGLCVESGGSKSYRCDCPSSWSGDLCNTDVDECLSTPCPAPSTCLNSRGSFSCQCPLGFLLQKGAGCVLVRTFLGQIEIPWSLLDSDGVKDSTLHEIKEDIVRILNSSFSAISGYYQSSVTSDSHTSSNSLMVQNLFSLESNVTMFDLSRSLQNYAKVCETSPERPASCQLVLHLQHRIQALSLCHVRDPGCDNETAVCADPAGLAFCQCKPGFFKYSKTDHSCRACDDGYKLENGACVRCPFGLGGFNCSNPYQLITVIIAAGGGGLLLILVVALAFTCCRKSKHDISKLIFKSGDFQMSPYAEYPKTPRSSEWGREAIEMQENGSTKNLLQMTDVYYSPALRTSELERNGLYPPYSGLPGSRHSCIYPGQYNPSFINEENRRRDYF
ncbi:protein HEG homolog 1 isoform X2 [Bufo bufo]|uniref:protein HEG homolog 1 isoform X2 n=1 Tax=Bufo bufo TaxID=8384 RepID=UPI001ABE12CC|nr:protein HEG homolog 1 isoform X2 [Bufo bufo]